MRKKKKKNDGDDDDYDAPIERLSEIIKTDAVLFIV